MLGWLRRQGLRRGVLGGNRTWQVVWLALMAGRLVRRLTRAEPDVVYCEELGPGEAIVVSHLTDG